MTKLWAVFRGQLRPPARRGERPPLLLVVSVGRPRAAQSMLQADSIAPGIVVGRAGGGTEVCLVDVARLGRRPGTGYLKLFDHRAEQRVANIAHVHNDPDLSILERKTITELIRNHPEIFDQSERHISAEAIYGRGYDEGKTEGKTEGLAFVIEQRLGRPLRPAELVQLGSVIEREGDRAVYGEVLSATTSRQLSDWLRQVGVLGGGEQE